MKKLFSVLLFSSVVFQLPAVVPEGSDLGTTSIGFTPDLLLTLALASGTPEGQNSPPLAGTLYAGGARNHEEVVFGLGGSAYNLELLGQYRRYWNQDCRGVFAGFYGSVSWMRGSIEFLPGGGSRIPGEAGTSYHSVGLRLGGNVGVRWDLGGIALTPRLGLVIPALVNFGYGELSGDQVKTLYLTNAFLRALDFAVVIEFLSQAPALSP